MVRRSWSDEWDQLKALCSDIKIWDRDLSARVFEALRRKTDAEADRILRQYMKEAEQLSKIATRGTWSNEVGLAFVNELCRTLNVKTDVVPTKTSASSGSNQHEGVASIPNDKDNRLWAGRPPVVQNNPNAEEQSLAPVIQQPAESVTTVPEQVDQIPEEAAAAAAALPEEGQDEHPEVGASSVIAAAVVARAALARYEAILAMSQEEREEKASEFLQELSRWHGFPHPQPSVVQFAKTYAHHHHPFRLRVARRLCEMHEDLGAGLTTYAKIESFLRDELLDALFESAEESSQGNENAYNIIACRKMLLRLARPCRRYRRFAQRVFIDQDVADNVYQWIRDLLKPDMADLKRATRKAIWSFVWENIPR